jgi:hypothetical protein
VRLCPASRSIQSRPSVVVVTRNAEFAQHLEPPRQDSALLRLGALCSVLGSLLLGRGGSQKVASVMGLHTLIFRI